MNVYATVKGIIKLIFTIEYDSNPDNDDAVNIAIVTTSFDATGLTGMTIFKIPDMNKEIETSLNAMFKNANINNLRFRVEPSAVDKPWKAFWTGGIIMQATNGGSIATEHEAQVVPAETKVVQLLEIIGKFSSTPYYRMRYVRRPNPIILEPDLHSLGVTIEGIGATANSGTDTTIRECELPEEMHHEILERAVTLAKIAWQGATMTQTALAVQASK